MTWWDDLPFWSRELVAMFATFGLMVAIISLAVYFGEQRR